MTPPDPQQSDSMDFEGCYWRMVDALEPYWFEQSSMSPETAIAKLVAEHEQLHALLLRCHDALPNDSSFDNLAREIRTVAADGQEQAR